MIYGYGLCRGAWEGWDIQISAGRRLYSPLYVPPTFPDRYTLKDTLDCLSCFGITVIETTYWHVEHDGFQISLLSIILGTQNSIRFLEVSKIWFSFYSNVTLELEVPDSQEFIERLTFLISAFGSQFHLITIDPLTWRVLLVFIVLQKDLIESSHDDQTS